MAQNDNKNKINPSQNQINLLSLLLVQFTKVEIECEPKRCKNQ